MCVRPQPCGCCRHGFRSSCKVEKGVERRRLWNNSRSRRCKTRSVRPAAVCNSRELQTAADATIGGRSGGGGGTASRARRAQPPPKRGQRQRASTAKQSTAALLCCCCCCPLSLFLLSKGCNKVRRKPESLYASPRTQKQQQ